MYKISSEDEFTFVSTATTKYEGNGAGNVNRESLERTEKVGIKHRRQEDTQKNTRSIFESNPQSRKKRLGTPRES